MTATVLIHGTMFRSAERRTSKAGKLFVTGKIRDSYGEDTTWWNVVAFSESACEELLDLRDGDGVAVSGPMRAEIYEGKDGKSRMSFSVIADVAISAKTMKRVRDKAKREQHVPNGREFDDEIPF